EGVRALRCTEEIKNPTKVGNQEKQQPVIVVSLGSPLLWGFLSLPCIVKHGRDKKPHKSGEPRETTITGCWLCSNNDEVATLNNNYRTGPTYSTLNLRS
ncbi:hypothetical protein PSZ67_23665, partial [Shigella sonnei]|nr:hypothetical protein [Shigella sonnei]